MESNSLTLLHARLAKSVNAAVFKTAILAGIRRFDSERGHSSILTKTAALSVKRPHVSVEALACRCPSRSSSSATNYFFATLVVYDEEGFDAPATAALRYMYMSSDPGVSISANRAIANQIVNVWYGTP